MLIRSIILLAISAGALALAACASAGGAIAGAEAAQAAQIAASQAAIVTTQALTDLAIATSQMADAVGNAVTHPPLPDFGKPSKVNLIIDTPTATIVDKDGHRTIFLKNDPASE